MIAFVSKIIGTYGFAMHLSLEHIFLSDKLKNFIMLQDNSCRPSGQTPSSFLVRMAAFALSLSIPTLSIGMNLNFGGGGNGCSGVSATAAQPTQGFGLTVIDQLGGFRSPARVAISSIGDIFVTDHKKGLVTVFNVHGEKIATLTGLQAPIGLAISETVPASQPLPANCPIDQQLSEKLVKRYEKKLLKFKIKVEKYEKSVAKYQHKLVLAAGNKRKERRYQKKINKYTAKVAKYRSRMQKFEDLLAANDTCKVSPYEGIPLPLIYVGDEGDGSVKILDRGNVSTLGLGSGEFVKPNGIAVMADNTVYVVDSAVHEVKVYDNLGVLLTSFGGEGAADGQLNFPVDIAINEAVGEVYITDFWNERIVVFNLQGDWLRNMPPPDNDAGDHAYFRPSGLGIDPDGNLYVVDSALSSVVIIDRQGTLLDIIGYRNGQYCTGDLTLPLDAAADGQRVYVTSGKNRSVKVFGRVAP